MPLLHVSISADDPRGVAAFLARVMGGEAMPFPPFPDSWIAFGAEDDGTAIEVYATTHVLKPGPEQVACDTGERDGGSTFAHVALCSVLSRDAALALAAQAGWTARLCDRGPFECVEVWLEDRLLVELLDGAMQRDYRTGMKAAHWASMFGLGR